jgi:hypothetical protein
LLLHRPFTLLFLGFFKYRKPIGGNAYLQVTGP